jgi:hypothetical protein
MNASVRLCRSFCGNPVLIRKLEGVPGVVGQRMPFDGPFLDADTLARIRAWVDARAPNN